jgi:ABC-2 type transport system permease protein
MTTTMTHPVGTADSTSPDVIFPAIPFSRLLRVEWGKATDTRASRWLLAAVAASTVGLMLVPILSPSSIEQSYTSYLGFAAVGLSILLPVVAILTLTSEWSQRTNLTTFTQEPRRMRVVIAKIGVSLMLGVGGAVFGALVTAAGLGVAAASGRTLDADLGAGLMAAYMAYVLLNVMTGVALGALVHNSAAAIVASFVLPIGSRFWARHRSWWPTGSTTRPLSTGCSTASGPVTPGRSSSPWPCGWWRRWPPASSARCVARSTEAEFHPPSNVDRRSRSHLRRAS